MIVLSAIYYMQEQNEPSCPEIIKLGISTDSFSAVHAEVLKYLNNSVEGEWKESDDSFFGNECWQFENDEGLYCFVNKDYVSN